MSRTIDNYLKRYAALDIDEQPVKGLHYRYVLTIVAFDEPAEFLQTVLGRLIERRDVLVIVVVNVPDNATTGQINNTRRLLSVLRSCPDVIAIDRVSRPIPYREGVGLARKIAADMACLLIARGDIDCPLIFMTDADVVLPPGYFQLNDAHLPIAKGTYLFPFRHRSDDPDLQRAADLYELHLRHYVRGLRSAGSGYGFQSLGSTIAIHSETYASVRGVPRRNAAEDFYLLNKSAKIAPITCLRTPRIEIMARRSQRVPFGTGPALRSMPDDAETFTSYNPQVFADLRSVLQYLKSWALGDPGTGHVDENMVCRLTDLNWQRQQEKLTRQHPAGEKRLRAVTEWFDGFRSLRFLRLAAEQSPPIPLLETLRCERKLPEAGPAELLAAFLHEELDEVEENFNSNRL